MATRTVTGTIKRPTGKPWYGARVGFALLNGAFTLDTTYPQDAAAVTAADGTFSIDLESGLAVTWVCHLPDGDTFRFELLDDSTDPISIEELRAIYWPANNPGLPMLSIVRDGETTGQAVAGITLRHPTDATKQVETWLGTKADGTPSAYAIAKLTALGIGGGAVDSVNGMTGDVVISVGETYANVTSYGMVGDGDNSKATANAAAFLAAQDDLAASGGTLYVPPGDYRGRFALDTSNIELLGGGRGTTIFKVPDGVNNPSAALTITGDGTAVRKMTIDGNKDGQDFSGEDMNSLQESDGINVYASNVVIQWCHVKNSASHGIIVWEAATVGGANASRAAGVREYIHIVDNIVENNGVSVNKRAAIDLALNTDARRAIVSRNIVKGGANTQTGVTLHGGAHVIISENLVLNTQDACFKPHTGGPAVIANNIGLTNTQAFLNTSGGGVTGLVVTGNFAGPLDGGNGPVRFASLDAAATDVLIAGNTYRTLSSVSEFLLASGCVNVNVAANQMRANSGANTAFLRVAASVTNTNIVIRRDNLRTGVVNDYRLDSGAALTGITFEGVNDLATANPDTSGATLTDLETEVNELKAMLRAAKLLGV